jgi:hypothetical protein
MSVESFRHENMIPSPAASAVVRPIWETEDGVLLCYGTAANTVLEADTSTYAPGCIYIKSLAAGTSIIYVNEGTKAVPDFDVVTVA